MTKTVTLCDVELELALDGMHGVGTWDGRVEDMTMEIKTTTKIRHRDTRAVLRIVAGGLHGADLAGANLRGADVRGADLRWANLSDANRDQGGLRACRWGR